MNEFQPSHDSPEGLRDKELSRWDPREILGDVELSRPIPGRALLLSFAALAIPILVAVLFPALGAEDTGILIWLTALIPAFLFTYYRGWPGATLALAMGMAALTLTQVAMALAGVAFTRWALLTGLVVVYIATSLGIGFLTDLLHAERRKAERMALTDPLTGMPNRRHSVVYLDKAFAAAQRGIPVSVVLFDVDRFKEYNDSRGHVEGDEAIKAVGMLIFRSSRRMNMAARWGGDEFLCVLQDTPVEGARIFAERVLSEVHQAFPDGIISLSAGLARYVRGMDTPARLLAAADQAMYAAKAAGGDCVRSASENVEPAGRAT